MRRFLHTRQDKAGKTYYWRVGPVRFGLQEPNGLGTVYELLLCSWRITLSQPDKW